MDTRQPPPQADEAHVWYVHPEPDVSPDLRNRYEAVLSDDEHDRYRRFVFESARLRYLVAHVLVRTTLSRYSDVLPGAWTFSTNEFGRPEVTGPADATRWRFSLTHTEGLTAVAITSTADIGLDAERFSSREHNIDIARRFFASSEADALGSLSPDRQRRAFFDYWTLKEAYIKALGVGLSAPLQSFAFTLSDPPTVRFDDPASGDPAAWQFVRLSLTEEHACAVAMRHNRAPRVHVRNAGVW